MHLFDVLLFLLVISFAMPNLFKGKNKRVLSLIFIAAFVMVFVLDILLNGFKITMLFIHISAIILMIKAIINMIDVNKKTILDSKIFDYFIIAFSIISLVSTAVFMPTFQIVKPNGEYEIGHISDTLADNSRKDPYNDYGENRELNIDIYYPAENTSDCKLSEYVDAESMLSSWGYPAFLGSYLKNIKANSYINAQVMETDEKWPLVIFSHGMGSIPEAYMSIIENLASNGFVVVCINYTDYSMFSKIDNIIIPFEANDVETAMGSKDKGNSTVIKDALAVWSTDTQFVINELRSLNSEVTNEIDFNNIAIVGHSFGGSVAADVLYKDANIKAGVDLDGPIYGNALDGLSQPFLYIISDRASTNYDAIEKAGGDAERVKDIIQHFFNSIDSMCNNSNGDIYKVTIKGSSHSSFGDLLMYSPFKYFDAYPAQINPQRALAITNENILGFLNAQLKSSKTDMNTINKDDDVEFEYLGK
jgi:dienelactone hydrolase